MKFAPYCNSELLDRQVQKVPSTVTIPNTAIECMVETGQIATITEQLLFEDHDKFQMTVNRTSTLPS